MRAQFARMGVALEGSAGLPAASEAFEVMLANAGAVEAFLACETQWRVAAGMGGLTWLGLDYGAVDVVLRRTGLEDPDRVFRDLQVMESAALSVFWEAKT